MRGEIATTTAPGGSRASRRASSRCRVASLSGQVTTRTVEVESSCSSGSHSAPSACSGGSGLRLW
ncbi:hypothetical protein ADK60_24470 [Streptomyces sp. XY431]|nr:hypothetical protein ADK60_24470 [Streptomyces sp. XY431]